MESGDKIEYRLYDKKGKEHWLPGVIHGVRRYEDPATNFVKKETYLVDTGRHTRLDEVVFSHRDREVDKRVAKFVAKGKDYHEALLEVSKHDDLPGADELGVEKARQPEQVELPAEHIRPRT